MYGTKMKVHIAMAKLMNLYYKIFIDTFMDVI